MMISRGVEISIARDGEEMVCVDTTRPFTGHLVG